MVPHVNGIPAQKKRGQTSFEYLFLAVGVIIFIVLIYLILNGGIVGKQKTSVEAGLADFLKIGEYFLFFDNFDSGSSDQWTQRQSSWVVANKEYAQSDISDSQKTTLAGSLGWVNYFADVKITFPELPSVIGTRMGGIGARANKNNGKRYVCEMMLTSNDPKEGKIGLYRFTDFDTSAMLDESSSIPLDTSVHTIGMQVSGNSILCYWDSILQVNYTDSTPFKYGQVSLEARQSKAVFDIVRVKYQQGPNPEGPDPTAIPTSTALPSPSPSPTSIPTSSPSPSYKACDGTTCTTYLGIGVDTCTSNLQCGGEEAITGCSDGTLPGTCSATKPYYCQIRDPLRLKCSTCGCPALLPFCNANENCTAAPVSLGVFNVTAGNLTISSANIGWSTTMSANGSVEYGTTQSYGSIAKHSDNRSYHSLYVGGLGENTTYHYRITSCNATLCNTTGDFNFTTSALLRIIGISNTSLSAVSERIAWMTNINANGSVEYGPSASYGGVASHSANLTSHSLDISGLSPATLYHYRATSCNATLCNSTDDLNFTTPAAMLITDVVNYSILGISAIINWTTSQPANGTVEGGLSLGDYPYSASHSNNLVSHSLQLTNLAAGSLYYYRITSCDLSVCGSTGILANYNFTTLPRACFDNDSGIMPLQFGNVTTESAFYNDSCFNSTVLTENYCIVTAASSHLFGCDSCESGVCTAPYCGDFGSTVYTDTGTFNDGACFPCPSGSKLDYYCADTAMASRTISCICGGS